MWIVSHLKRSWRRATLAERKDDAAIWGGKSLMCSRRLKCLEWSDWEESAEAERLDRGQACKGSSTTWNKWGFFLSVMGSYREVLRKGVILFNWCFWVFASAAHILKSIYVFERPDCGVEKIIGRQERKQINWEAIEMQEVKVPVAVDIVRSDQVQVHFEGRASQTHRWIKRKLGRERASEWRLRIWPEPDSSIKFIKWFIFCQLGENHLSHVRNFLVILDRSLGFLFSSSDLSTAGLVPFFLFLIKNKWSWLICYQLIHYKHIIKLIF